MQAGLQADGTNAIRSSAKVTAVRLYLSFTCVPVTQVHLRQAERRYRRCSGQFSQGADLKQRSLFEMAFSACGRSCTCRTSVSDRS